MIISSSSFIVSCIVSIVSKIVSVNPDLEFEECLVLILCLCAATPFSVVVLCDFCYFLRFWLRFRFLLGSFIF